MSAAINFGSSIGFVNASHIRRAYIQPGGHDEGVSLWIEFSNGDELRVAFGLAKVDAENRLYIIQRKMTE